MDSKTTVIYFDSSDNANPGIAYRTRTTTFIGGRTYPEIHEESGEVDGLAGEAAEAILAGDVPSAEGLAELRDAFGPDVTLDGVGEIALDERLRDLVAMGPLTWKPVDR